METTLDELENHHRHDPKRATRKKKWLGALLNLLVPGMGTGYARFVNTGLVYYVVFYLVVFSVRFVAFNFALFCISAGSIVGFIIFLIVKGYRQVDNQKDYPEVKYDKWYIYIVFFIFHSIFWVVARHYVADRLAPVSFASVPTESMDPGLRAGDIIAYQSTHQLHRNDVAIFNNPLDSVMYAHRCIGLPGDSLALKRGTVFINGDSTLATTAVKYLYLVATGGAALTQRTLDKLEIEPGFYDGQSFRFFLTVGQAAQLKAMPVVKSIDIQFAAPGDELSGLFVRGNPYHWNADYFVSVYVPKKGSRIQFDARSAALYYNLVKSENPSAQLSLDPDGIFIDGKNTHTYEFKQNYYFMLGDNRHNSFDSRFYGFVPESRVLGKGLYIYWGTRKGRVGRKI